MSSPIRILHVDDDPSFAELTAAFLQRESDDLQVESVTSVEDALAKLDTDHVDCVVSDYDMPEQTGIHFLQTVRDRFPALPFILFTGKGSEEIASEAISAGVTDYLQKGGGETYQLLAQRIENATKEYQARQFELVAKQEPLDLLDRISDAFLSLDTQWRFTFLNDRAEEIFGMPADEILGESIWDVFPEARETPFYREYRESMQRGEPRTIEEYFEPWDRWYREHIYPADNGLSIIFHDITDEKTSQRELERLHELFDQAERLGNLGGWEFDSEGNATWTAGTRRIHEVNADYEPSLDTGLDFIHPDDRDMVEEATTAALNQGEPYDLTTRLETATGDLRWVRISGGPIDHGDTVRGFIQDITVQHEREQELREAKAQLEAAVGAGSVGTWQWYVKLDELYMDPTFALTFGVEPDSASSGVPLERFVTSIHDDDRDRVTGLIESALRDCGRYETEYRVKDAEGDIRWVIARGIVECDENGEPERFPGALVDITARKERERKVEQTRRRYETILQNSSDYVLIVNGNGVISYASPSIERVMGYPPDQVIGESAFEYVYDDDHHVAIDSFAEVVADPEKDIRVEYRAIAADGSIRWIEARGGNYLDDPVIDGVLVNARVITDRKRRERELERHRGNLEELHRATRRLYEAESVSECHEITIEAAVSILGFDWCTLAAPAADEPSMFEITAVSTDTPLEIGDRTFRVDEGIAGEVYQSKTASIVDDAQTAEGAKPTSDSIRSALTVPVGGWGIFQAVSTSSGAFDEHDRRHAELLVTSMASAAERLTGNIESGPDGNGG